MVIFFCINFYEIRFYFVCVFLDRDKPESRDFPFVQLHHFLDVYYSRSRNVFAHECTQLRTSNRIAASMKNDIPLNLKLH